MANVFHHVTLITLILYAKLATYLTEAELKLTQILGQILEVLKKLKHLPLGVFAANVFIVTNSLFFKTAPSKQAVDNFSHAVPQVYLNYEPHGEQQWVFLITL